MKIVNPLYDYAFKYLMENNRIAKKVISTLLECEVLELFVEQQELIAVNKKRGLKLYRLDFSAIILDENGKKQKVLIELQKSKLPTNTLRFRTYLGESYTKKEVVKDKLGLEETKVYPIISIYILGYNVVDIPYLCINIDNRITDTVTKKEVAINSDFVELLTHKTRIIQVRRLTEKRRSRLEQFLTLFNQAWVTSEKYILDLEEIPDEFQDIVNYLGVPVQDDIFRNQLKGEEEIDAIFRNQEAKLAMSQEALIQAKRLKLEAEEKVALVEREKIEAEEKAALIEREKIEAEKELTKLQDAQTQLIKHLLQIGTSISQVAILTGLDEEFISKYLK